MYGLSLTHKGRHQISLSYRGIIQTAFQNVNLFVDRRLRAHAGIFLAYACKITLEDIGGGVCKFVSLVYQNVKERTYLSWLSWACPQSKYETFLPQPPFW